MKQGLLLPFVKGFKEVWTIYAESLSKAVKEPGPELRPPHCCFCTLSPLALRLCKQPHTSCRCWLSQT